MIVRCLWTEKNDWLDMGELYEARYVENPTDIEIKTSAGWKLHKCDKFIVEDGEISELKYRIRKLEKRLHNQKNEISIMGNALRNKNIELDAMHYVWCDGGCDGGVHRWIKSNLSEEIVLEAERNTRRLRTWWNNSGNRRFWYNPEKAKQMIEKKRWFQFWK